MRVRLTPSVSMRVFGEAVDDGVHGLFQDGLGTGVGHRTRHRLGGGSAAGGNRGGGLALVPGHVGRHPTQQHPRQATMEESSRRDFENHSHVQHVRFCLKQREENNQHTQGKGEKRTLFLRGVHRQLNWSSATGESLFAGERDRWRPEYILSLLLFKVDTANR
ncbi:hypothetical protein JTE90_013737 [Oedothorax gibbosus]|uniref:Uncharacterized protein n=1 Tax=Oedothorax gibbosus TaxID=931172 RepID=A0AAV6UZI3_9ARAC|nr:hypothetical protein JTE90_013737 [Oedothorax gibbosus]